MSGQLKLLNSEQLYKLTIVYHKVKGTDYEAIRVRDAKEGYNQTGSNDAANNWNILSKARKTRMEETKTAIDTLLKESWLKY